MNVLIADSGSTKCEWCLLYNGKKKKVDKQGISPYFLDVAGIGLVSSRELLPALRKASVDVVYFYGTGCMSVDNRRIVQKALRQAFQGAKVHVTHDLMGAAISLWGSSKGIACNLGTGSFSCYFDRKKMAKST